MGPDEFMAEACRLAEESVANGWGGPFGAVIVRDGEIVARGQNEVLRTGDPTWHAETAAIRAAAAVVNATEAAAPTARPGHGTLTLMARPDGSVDPVPERSRMLAGMELYASGAPCPMCLSAIYWARLDAVHFANDWEAARSVGFDDAFQYEDFARPLPDRRLPIGQFRPDLGAPALAAWANRPHRHPY